MDTFSTRAGRTPLQWAALLVGVVFVLIGILGFVPGVTQSYDDLGWAGEDGAELLGSSA